MSIDAVVTGHRGEIVRDLVAADFEVFQDGKRQKVAFAQLVPVTTVAPASSGTGSNAFAERVATDAPRAAGAPIPRTPVGGRTFILVVDDLGLSVEGMTQARRALHAFVDTGLLPMDLVAIIRTGDVRGMGQGLTNDRGALHAVIDALRYNTLSRKGVAPSGDVIQVGPSPPEFEDVGGLQRAMSTAGSLAALNLIVRAARDVPGRKTVIFASEGFPLAVGTDATTVPDVDPRVRYGVDRAVDQATRSGVVIYAIDTQGLQVGGLRASDDIHSIDPRNRDAMAGVVRDLAARRLRANRDAQESLAYLAEQTGGFAVLNTNDLADGLRRISNDVRDYYLIGYEPDQSTFSAERKSPRLHKIVVNVTRPGLRVRTRKEFIGVSDPDRPTGPPTPAQQLVRAAISPFAAATIPLHAINVAAYSAGHGLFVRTVLHVEAHALTFSTTPTGTKTASADLVGLLFDRDGTQVDTISTGFDITLENTTAEEAIKTGLVYVARVPIAKPGGYQLRYAVRDRRSGAIGSVGGFVNVPDVIRGVFALSGLVLRADEGTVASESIDSDRFSLRPIDALRVYSPGTQLKYAYEIYNAISPVQLVMSVWRGAERVASSPPQTLTPPSGKPIAFPAGGAFTLEHSLPAGRYVLQLAAQTTDPGTGRVRRAVQQAEFEMK